MARFLAALDFQVLVVDADASTNGLTLLHLDQVNRYRRERKSQEGGVYSDAGSSVAIVPLDDGTSLVPAVLQMAQTASDESDETLRQFLMTTLHRIQGDFDFIFLDTQAGSGLTSIVAVEAADQIVIVSELDPISDEAVLRLRAILGERLDYARTWVLLNKVLPEYADRSLEPLEKIRYLPVIPWDAKVMRALADKELAVDIVKGNWYTGMLMRVCASLFGERVASLASSWSRGKDEALSSPLERQKSKLEARVRILSSQIQILEARRARIDTRTKSLSLQTMWALAALTPTVYMGLSFGANVIWYVAAAASGGWLYVAFMATYVARIAIRKATERSSSEAAVLLRPLEHMLADTREDLEKVEASYSLSSFYSP